MIGFTLKFQWKVSPIKGVMTFGKKGKLSHYYITPFEKEKSYFGGWGWYEEISHLFEFVENVDEDTNFLLSTI